MRVSQEFYCATSGGGCGGFITFPLNMAINGIVEVVCPKCAHKHQRRIKDGVLTDDGRTSGSVNQEITPVLSAWHKKAQHPESKRRVGGDKERVAVVIDPKSRAKKASEAESRAQAQAFLDESKFDRFGSKL